MCRIPLIDIHKITFLNIYPKGIFNMASLNKKSSRDFNAAGKKLTTRYVGDSTESASLRKLRSMKGIVKATDPAEKAKLGEDLLKELHDMRIVSKNMGASIRATKLVKQGAALDITDAEGNSPFMLSFMHQGGIVLHVAMMDRNPDVWVHNDKGYSVLDCAPARNNYNPIYFAAMERGMRMPDDLLARAAGEGNIDLMKQMIKNKVNIEARRPAFYNCTPLLDAATMHKFDAMRVLLKAGADPFAKDGNGRNALDLIQIQLNSTMSADYRKQCEKIAADVLDAMRAKILPVAAKPKAPKR